MKTSPLDLAPKYLSLVQKILRAHVPDCTVWAFGSRAQRNAKPTSDLDLAIAGSSPLDLKTLDALQDAFSTSVLPIKVDIVDFNRAAPSFRAIIEEQKVVVQE